MQKIELGFSVRIESYWIGLLYKLKLTFNFLKGKTPVKNSVSSHMLHCDYTPFDNFIVATCESNKRVFINRRKLIN